MNNLIEIIAFFNINTLDLAAVRIQKQDQHTCIRTRLHHRIHRELLAHELRPVLRDHSLLDHLGRSLDPVFLVRHVNDDGAILVHDVGYQRNTDRRLRLDLIALGIEELDIHSADLVHISLDRVTDLVENVLIDDLVCLHPRPRRERTHRGFHGDVDVIRTRPKRDLRHRLLERRLGLLRDRLLRSLGLGRLLRGLSLGGLLAGLLRTLSLGRLLRGLFRSLHLGGLLALGLRRILGLGGLLGSRLILRRSRHVDGLYSVPDARALARRLGLGGCL